MLTPVGTDTNSPSDSKAKQASTGSNLYKLAQQEEHQHALLVILSITQSAQKMTQGRTKKCSAESTALSCNYFAQEIVKEMLQRLTVLHC